ncbi:hypothetical protein TNCV_1667201 [Trichonephila clavipes]|nr:hypothetical protein TNCV_1667201 [Trichonephila clavipes]
MIPAYNKKRCAAVPFETGIHFRRKTDFFHEEDTTMSYSGFEPEPTRIQYCPGHPHVVEISVSGSGGDKVCVPLILEMESQWKKASHKRRCFDGSKWPERGLPVMESLPDKWYCHQEGQPRSPQNMDAYTVSLDGMKCTMT